MKVYIIKASTKGLFKDYKKAMGAPPQSIYSLAAATPEWVEVELIDETSEGPADTSLKVDLVAIFMSTPDACHGYELADKFRERNIPVVFGGLHASFLPEEALEHGDAVMCGETEPLWPQLLEDLWQDKMQRMYRCDKPVSLTKLGRYPHQFIDLNSYDGLGSVVVSRGCKFKCNFCTVHRFFPEFRYRPVGEIVDEIKDAGLEYIELHADNLIADRDYAMELFAALKQLDIKWMAEATLNMAEYPEILEAAAESGLFYLLVGLETSSQEALTAAGKNFIKVDRAKQNIARMHEFGIAVDSAMIFGFDQHTPDIFEQSLEFIHDIELDYCDSVILTPFPGTLLYQQYEREDRLLTKDWSKYDCSTAVFQPAQMTPQQLEEGAQWFQERYNGLGNSMKRTFARARNLGWFNSGLF